MCVTLLSKKKKKIQTPKAFNVLELTTAIDWHKMVKNAELTSIIVMF